MWVNELNVHRSARKYSPKPKFACTFFNDTSDIAKKFRNRFTRSWQEVKICYVQWYPNMQDHWNCCTAVQVWFYKHDPQTWTTSDSTYSANIIIVFLCGCYITRKNGSHLGFHHQCIYERSQTATFVVYRRQHQVSISIAFHACVHFWPVISLRFRFVDHGAGTEATDLSLEAIFNRKSNFRVKRPASPAHSSDWPMLEWTLILYDHAIRVYEQFMSSNGLVNDSLCNHWAMFAVYV